MIEMVWFLIQHTHTHTHIKRLFFQKINEIMDVNVFVFILHISTSEVIGAKKKEDGRSSRLGVSQTITSSI